MVMVERIPWLSTADDLRRAEGDNINDHDAADIICNECQSMIVTLHARTKH
jgi:hypothetical protein